MVPPIIFFLNVLIYKHVIAYADVIGRVLFHNIFSVVYVGFFLLKTFFGYVGVISVLLLEIVTIFPQ